MSRRSDEARELLLREDETHREKKKVLLEVIEKEEGPHTKREFWSFTAPLPFPDRRMWPR